MGQPIVNKSGVALRYWLAGILVLGGIAILISLTAAFGKADVVEVSELLGSPDRFEGKRIEVYGIVVPHSERYDAEKIELKFRMADRQGGDGEIAVHCNLPKPDAFKDEAHVIVTGFYDPKEGLLRGEDLKAKCPSRYEEDLEGKGSPPGRP